MSDWDAMPCEHAYCILAGRSVGPVYPNCCETEIELPRAMVSCEITAYLATVKCCDAKMVSK